MPLTRTQMTVAEAAAVIGITKQMVQRRIRNGLMPAIKLPGITSPYLIDPGVVELALIQEQAKRKRRADREARRAAREAAGIKLPIPYVQPNQRKNPAA